MATIVRNKNENEMEENKKDLKQEEERVRDNDILASTCLLLNYCWFVYCSLQNELSYRIKHNCVSSINMSLEKTVIACFDIHYDRTNKYMKP